MKTPIIATICLAFTSYGRRVQQVAGHKQGAQGVDSLASLLVATTPAFQAPGFAPKVHFDPMRLKQASIPKNEMQNPTVGTTMVALLGAAAAFHAEPAHAYQHVVDRADTDMDKLPVFVVYLLEILAFFPLWAYAMTKEHGSKWVNFKCGTRKIKHVTSWLKKTGVIHKTQNLEAKVAKIEKAKADLFMQEWRSRKRSSVWEEFDTQAANHSKADHKMLRIPNLSKKLRLSLAGDVPPPPPRGQATQVDDMQTAVAQVQDEIDDIHKAAVGNETSRDAPHPSEAKRFA